MRRRKIKHYRGRLWFTQSVLTLAMVLLAGRALQLQIIDSDYLQQQGNARFLRVVNEAPTRGMILDRHNQPLAISTPVDSLWANPDVLWDNQDSVRQLARLIDVKPSSLRRSLKNHLGKEFMYLKRQVSPTFAQNVLEKNIPGVSVQREYRRYYPAGEAAGHILGFSNIDDKGQEGLELLYDSVLTGRPGKSRVLKDLYGRTVEKVESLGLSEAGDNVQLSLDRRLQYLAYRELKRAVNYHHAKAGTAIIVDVRNGEILALVNQPSFNPNNRSALSSERFRNRAATDLFEPGSTLKPFVVVAALDAGFISPATIFDTSPGYTTIGSKTIRDARNYGRLTVAGVIKKSSNVGATKIALQMPARKIWQTLRQFKFGSISNTNLPGEASGQLLPADRWTKVDQASISFGYGISTTSMQLVRAYAALANNGLMSPLSIRKLTSAPKQVRVVSEKTARQMQRMLEGAVMQGGTGIAADVPYYRIAGKTGTVRKYINGAYSEDSYIALFAGFAPVSQPRLAMVVTVDDPRRNGYYGGRVAAPVFRNVMAGALRLMNITPDKPMGNMRHLVKAGTREAG